MELSKLYRTIVRTWIIWRKKYFLFKIERIGIEIDLALRKMKCSDKKVNCFWFFSSVSVIQFGWFLTWERLLKQALSLTMEQPTLNSISSAAYRFLPKWCDCCDSLKIRNSLFISFIACCQLRARVLKWKRTDLECSPPLSCTMRFSS